MLNKLKLCLKDLIICIDVTKLNANVNGYIEMLEEKNRSLEM